MLFIHAYMLWSFLACALWPQAGGTPEGELRALRRFGSFTDAQALAVDPAGNVYVVEGRDRRIVKLSAAGNVAATWGGYAWTGEGADRLLDLAAPNGIDVYAADYGNHRVLRFDRNLNFVSSLPGEVEGEETRRFGYVRSVAVSRLGSLFVVDGDNDRIVEIDGNQVTRRIGGLDAGEGRLHKPRRVRIGTHDDIYVLEERGIVRYDTYGTFAGLLPGVRFRAAAPADTSLLLLDSCTVTEWGGGAAPAAVEGNVCAAGEPAVDIAAVHDSVYVLRRNAIEVYARSR